MKFVIPIKTVSLSNQREHWATRASRAKRERFATFVAFPRQLRGDLGPLFDESATVTLTRIAPRKLDDDNLRGALKSVRDEIARLLGVDDGSARVRWNYGYRKGPPAVEVEVVLGKVLATVEAQP